MGVTYVAAGTYVSGNNATLTPGIPPGLLAGDFMLLLTAHREDGGTGSNTPAGWTQGPGGISTSPTAVEQYARCHYRFWQAGDAAPSVTFSGGGSNDTTQAIILAFRGVRTANPVERLTFSGATFPYGEAAGALTQFVFDGPAIKAGDQLLVYRAATNDETPNNSPYITPSTGGTLSLTTISNTTTQGFDAALDIITATATLDAPAGTYNAVPPRLSSGAVALTDGLVIHQEVAYTHVAAGGLAVGGAATASLRKAVYSHTATGGLVAGGDAGLDLHHSVFAHSGSGGLVVGGAAGIANHNSVHTHVAAGGLAVGGAAGLVFVAPETYYIDPFNGNDSNNGSSWALAFKSFHPIGDGLVTLGPGYRVRIAKTPEPVATGSFFSPGLAWQSGADTANGWRQSIGYALPASMQPNLKVISDNRTDAGWVIPSATYFGDAALTLQPYATTVYRFFVQGTFLAERLVAYKALAATLNLSGFNRLEMRFGPRFVSGAVRTPWTVSLSLCSDAAGAVELLRVSLPVESVRAGTFAYDGVLPDGVNSISIRTIASTASVDSDFALFSIIACKNYGQADYVGHFTQYRFGDHEGSVWFNANLYYESGATTYVILTTNITGASTYNTQSLQLYTRTAVGWNTIVRHITPVEYPNEVFTNGVRVVLDPAHNPGKTTFALLDVIGSPADPITITGGYDVSTGGVTGETAIMHRGVEADYDVQAVLMPFMLADAQYVTFANLNVYSCPGGPFGIEGANTGFRFENCEIVSVMLVGGGTDSYQSTVVYKSGTRPTLTNTYFKDCVGLLYLFTQSDALSSIAQYAGLSMENCILAPYAGIALPASPARRRGINTQITMVGDLKIFCVAAPSAFSVVGVSSRENYQLPCVANGAAGTLRVYRAGCCYVIPAPSADGSVIGSYTFPAMVLENTYPVFTTIRELALTSGDYTFGGDVEYMEIPSITTTSSSSAWVPSSSPGADYYTSHIFATKGIHVPPLHIRSLTHLGGKWPSLASSLLGVFHSTRGGVQVSDLDLSGTGSVFDYTLVDGSGAQAETSGVFGELMAIVDGVSFLPGRTYSTPNGELVGGKSSMIANGIYDLRGVTIQNPADTYPVKATAPKIASAAIRFKSCTITNLSVASYVPPTPETAGTLANLFPSGFDSGVVFEECTMEPTAYTTGMAVSSLTEFDQTPQTGVFNTGQPLTIIKDSPPRHGTYYYPGVAIEKDFTILDGVSFTWRTRNMYRIATPLAVTLPLGTFPVKLGKTVTITLKTRRPGLTTFCGLVVYHNGCAGFLVPEDFQEIIALNTAAVDTWQIVTVSFVCQRSGLIDVEWTHFGLEGVNAWFTDLRVVET